MLDNEALSFIEKSQYDGSDLYYSLLYQDKNSKRFLSLLFAIEYELIQITTNIQDLGIARQKLQWWQEELLRGLNNEARHPLTKSFASTDYINPDIFNDLFHCVINCQTLLNPYVVNTSNEYIKLFKTNFGALWDISQSISHQSSESNIELIGTCRYYLYALSNRHLLQQQGREILPQTVSIFDCYKTIIDSLEKVEIPRSELRLNYARIMKDLLLLYCKASIQKQDDDFRGITPLRKLLQAWYVKTF